MFLQPIKIKPDMPPDCQGFTGKRFQHPRAVVFAVSSKRELHVLSGSLTTILEIMRGILKRRGLDCQTKEANSHV